MERNSSIQIRQLLFLFFSFAATITSAQLTESTLPIVIINTNGQIIQDEPKIVASMGIIANESGMNAVSDSFNAYNGKIGIELRGASSQALYPKKNYGIELLDENDLQISAEILGMPSEQDWVLHGPYGDKTLLRNLLTFHLWNKMDRYGSRTRPCEVIVNDEYMGLYLMMEKIKRDNDRVDISKLTEDENTGDDLTGGYIIKIDKFDGSNSGEGWPSPYPPFDRSGNQEVFFQYEYPKGDEITNAQAQYIQSVFDAFEEALHEGEPGSFRKYISIPSFVDFSIINEVSKNIDGYRLSTFLHKDKDSDGGRIMMGPIWDFNLAYGNAGYCDGGQSDGWAWQFNQVCPEDSWLVPFWWERFLRDEYYLTILKNRWLQLRMGDFSTTAIHQYIDSVTMALQEPIERNNERWPTIGEWIWPNEFVGETYEEEVDYLKDWISDRMEWLDTHIAALRLPTGELIHWEDEIDKIFLAPNPASSVLSISSTHSVSYVTVFDLSGKFYFTQDVNAASADISIQALKRNTYLILVGMKDGTLFHKKFIKD